MSDGAPYRTLARKTVFTNQVFDVYADHIRADDGTEVREYCVIAPKTALDGSLVTGVTVLPIYQDKIALIHMHRHALNEAFWECPRGFLVPDEPPAVSAVRELREETGLDCPPENLIDLGTIVQEASTLAARVHLFAAPDCVKVADGPEHHELGMGAMKLFPIEEVARMAADGGIEDATTLISYFRWRAQSANRE